MRAPTIVLPITDILVLHAGQPLNRIQVNTERD
jgi:hypothetical protein